CGARAELDDRLAGATSGSGGGAGGSGMNAPSSSGLGGASTTGSGAGGCVASTDFATDPQHCGRCDHPCLGGTCVAGVCQPTVLKDLEATGATALAVDGSSVFFASPVQRINKDGSGWTTLADATPDVFGVAVDDSAVYWTLPSASLVRVDKAS